MSEEKGYNGWTNYETWNVKLWLDNDQGLYNEMNEMARESKDIYDLSQTIEQVIDHMNPLCNESSMFADILRTALLDVNWMEIAEAYYEDLDLGESE
jgi:hypothetical protein